MDLQAQKSHEAFSRPLKFRPFSSIIFSLPQKRPVDLSTRSLADSRSVTSENKAQKVECTKTKGWPSYQKAPFIQQQRCER